MKKTTSLVALAAAAALAGAGCAIPAATVVAAGFTAAEAGATAFVRGELRAARRYPFDQLAAASVQAVYDLGFQLTETKRHDDWIYLEAEDDRGDRGSIRVSRRTEVVSVVRIRVGSLGDRAVAGLVLNRIEEILPEAPTLEDVLPPDELTSASEAAAPR